MAAKKQNEIDQLNQQKLIKKPPLPPPPKFEEPFTCPAIRTKPAPVISEKPSLKEEFRQMAISPENTTEIEKGSQNQPNETQSLPDQTLNITSRSRSSSRTKQPLGPPKNFVEPRRSTRRSTRIALNQSVLNTTKSNPRASSHLAMKSMLNNKKIDINDPLHRILVKCSDDDVVTLSSLFPRSSQVKKLGEGVYAEVYSHNGLAVKVMPVNGSVRINDAQQKTLQDILGEIAITKILSELSGSLPYYYSNTFVRLVKVNIAKGTYPKILDDAWVDYDKNVKPSENDRPAKMLKSNQMYVVFQLSHGGVALEDFKVKNYEQAISIFQQVAFGMAVAESRYEFEHRDLHVGNVLIKEVDPSKNAKFELRGDCLTMNMSGVEVTIIDFTLSRATHHDEFTHQPLALYSDLDQDPELFEGQGDIQFQVYRDMADLIPKLPNRWRIFYQKTNILWLIYLHQNILNKLPKKAKNRKKFSDLKSVLKNMDSCVDYYHLMKENYR